MPRIKTQEPTANMSRSDWTALITEPASEYVARTELQRFGLTPYLPQLRRRLPTRAGKYVMRQYPLFPRYILIHINEAFDPAIHMARGIIRFRPVLADDQGRPWRAPCHIIEAVQAAEDAGHFDEILHKGDAVTLAFGVLATIRAVLTETSSGKTAELLMPLLGGARARTPKANIVRA